MESKNDIFSEMKNILTKSFDTICDSDYQIMLNGIDDFFAKTINTAVNCSTFYSLPIERIISIVKKCKFCDNKTIKTLIA